MYTIYWYKDCPVCGPEGELVLKVLPSGRLCLQCAECGWVCEDPARCGGPESGYNGIQIDTRHAVWSEIAAGGWQRFASHKVETDSLTGW